MDDLKHLFKHNYLSYASYVILDRAIPHISDGLKPVQRRILWTLFEMDDNKLHKVANVAGQTMALHPHGDAPIVDALVNLANKGYLLDRQGNFGNPLTGDPSAAGRYIETRLSSLAKFALFNPKLTKFTSSYDGRKKEPLTLPSKIPLLLLHGAEGIAVGMSTKILPHNFKELLEGQIALLENKKPVLLPDFPSGGIMDPSEYDDGFGPVHVRAKIETVDPKTLVIRDICFGTTTESTIRSIDEAAKKGKLKIEEISDYTAEKIEIEIKLPRGVKPEETLNALYAFTDCSVTVHPKMTLIKDKNPCEMRASEILEYNLELVKHYLKEECLIEKHRLEELIFAKTLEQIFIEEKIYKPLETISSLKEIFSYLETAFVRFHALLHKEPSKQDFERLLQIPIRRISRFDIEQNQKEIQSLKQKIEEIEKKLKNFKRFVISYLKELIQKYSKEFPRKTQISSFEKIDIKQASLKSIRVSYDPDTGYLGSKVSGEFTLSCQNQDKLLLCFKNGVYQIFPPKEKEFIHIHGNQLAYLGVADKTTPLTVIYYDSKEQTTYAKKFLVDKFIQNKVYHFLSSDQQLLYLSNQNTGKIKLSYIVQGRKQGRSSTLDLETVPLKKVSVKGMKIVKKQMNTIEALT